MSALPTQARTAPARPSTRPGTRPAPSRTELRLVPAPRRRRAARAPFVVVLLSLLAGGLVGLLLLNTVLAQGAFTVSDLKQRAATLTDQEQALLQVVAVEQSPQKLAARAIALGMVPSTNPAFIRLSDGAVLGVPTPGKVTKLLPGPLNLPPAPKPTATPSPSGSASASASGTATPASATGGATKPATAPAGKPSAKPSASTSPKPSPTPSPRSSR